MGLKRAYRFYLPSCSTSRVMYILGFHPPRNGEGNSPKISLPRFFQISLFPSPPEAGNGKIGEIISTPKNAFLEKKFQKLSEISFEKFIFSFKIFKNFPTSGGLRPPDPPFYHNFSLYFIPNFTIFMKN